MIIRKYNNYEEYLNHQSSKFLNYGINKISVLDNRCEEFVFKRYQGLFDFKQKSIICLGARVGGEVRAFKQLNALAIGIDIQPGEKNEHVLYGDFHNINFPNNIFDFVFCNAIDHVLYLDVFLQEIDRILKPNGILLLEVAIQKMGPYEVLDTLDINPIKEIILKYFSIKKELDIDNVWKGVLLIIEKFDKE